jgi:choloylglycine hydrolase
MKQIIAAIICLVASQAALPCTTFLINKNGQLVFGRNYDWITASGFVCSNQRGQHKTSMESEDGPTITWTSKYGSLTFNQYGKEFPTGGMNEKGLVVELMWLDATEYPKEDNRPAVGVLQWIQYQLDCSETIDDIIASDNTLRISGHGTTPLHYLVADAKGNAATIEFLDGKMVVHKGNDLPFAVLTNDTYEESILQTNNASTGQSFSDNSIDRFAKACSMVKEFQTTNSTAGATDYAFSILNKVSQGNFTKWSIVYDITNKKVLFKSDGHTTIKSVDFASFNFDCATSSKMFNINQDKKGDISSYFTNFSIAASKPILEATIKESASRVPISDDIKEKLLNYNNQIQCTQSGIR